MIRVIFEEGLFFLLPFAVFALFLLLRRRNLLRVESWSGGAVWLAIAGCCAILLSLLLTAMLEKRPQGGFEPTHVENGTLVPGRFR